jgi:hypothetical protein
MAKHGSAAAIALPYFFQPAVAIGDHPGWMFCQRRRQGES